MHIKKMHFTILITLGQSVVMYCTRYRINKLSKTFCLSVCQPYQFQLPILLCGSPVPFVSCVYLFGLCTVSPCGRLVGVSLSQSWLSLTFFQHFLIPCSLHTPLVNYPHLALHATLIGSPPNSLVRYLSLAFHPWSYYHTCCVISGVICHSFHSRSLIPCLIHSTCFSVLLFSVHRHLCVRLL